MSHHKKIIAKWCIVILFGGVLMMILAPRSTMTFSHKSPNEALSVTDDITISIKKDSITDTSLILLIENNTAQAYPYDMTYALEKKKNDIWYSWDDDVYFNALAAVLGPNEVNEFKVTWKAKLSKGQYRIVKPVVTSGGPMNVGVEFSIG